MSTLRPPRTAALTPCPAVRDAEKSIAYCQAACALDLSDQPLQARRVERSCWADGFTGDGCGRHSLRKN